MKVRIAKATNENTTGIFECGSGGRGSSSFRDPVPFKIQEINSKMSVKVGISMVSIIGIMVLYKEVIKL